MQQISLTMMVLHKMSQIQITKNHQKTFLQKFLAML